MFGVSSSVRERVAATTARKTPESSIKRFNPNDSDISCSSQLKDKLSGLTFGHADGYISLFDAASKSIPDENNRINLSVTEEGLFLKEYTFQVGNTRYRVPKAILEDCVCNANSLQTITLYREFEANRNTVGYRVFKRNNKSSFVLEVPSITTSTKILNLTQYSLNDISHISHLFEPANYHSLNIAISALERVKDNLTTEVADEIISKLIKNSFLYDHRFIEVLEIVKNTLTPEVANEIIDTLIKKGDERSICLAQSVLEKIGNNLPPEKALEYIDTIILALIKENFYPYFYSLSNALEKFEKKLSAEKKSEYANIIILKIIETGRRPHMEFATFILEIGNKLSTEDATAIISMLLKKNDSFSSDIASYVLEKVGGRLTTEQQSEYATAIILELIKKGDDYSLNRARVVLNTFTSSLSTEQQLEYTTAIILGRIKTHTSNSLSEAIYALQRCTRLLTTEQQSEFATAIISTLLMNGGWKSEPSAITKWEELTARSVLKLFKSDLTEKDAAVIISTAIKKGGIDNLSLAISVLKDFKSRLIDDTPYDELNTEVNLNSLNLRKLDEVFNHLNNRGSESLLTAINNLSSNKAKLHYMRAITQGLAKLDAAKFNSIRSAIEDILLNNPIYLEDPSIKDFIINKLLTEIKEEGLKNPVTLTPLVLRLFMEHINALNESEADKYMLDNNLFFVQLLYQSLISTDRDIKELALDLAAKYQKIPAITACLELSVVDNIYNPAEKNIPEDIYIILLVPNPNQLSNISYIGCRGNYFAKFLYSRHSDNTEWNNLNFFKQENDEIIFLNEGHSKDIKLEDIFDQLKIFKASYLFYINNQKLSEFLDSLNLGEYRAHFVEATTRSQSAIKFVTESQQQKLNAIFNQVLIPEEACQLAEYIPKDPDVNKEEAKVAKAKTLLRSISLKKEHLNKIYETFDFQDKSNAEKAQLFLCIAEFFVKYSSSHIFGIENKSPEALRRYSYALIHEAHKLDSGVVSDAAFTDWGNKLLGLEGAFSCTAVLSGEIKEFTKTYGQIRDTIMPPRWG